MVSTIRFRIAAGASRRAGSGVLLGIGPRFRLVLLRRPVSRPAQGQVVSQLLAEARSGPGGSPDAARVQALRRPTRGRRTPSRHYERLAMTPLGGRGPASL